jgi:hypothetical protein
VGTPQSAGFRERGSGVDLPVVSAAKIEAEETVAAD